MLPRALLAEQPLPHRSRCRRSPARRPRRARVIESVVTHVARFVSIGQLPSSRIDSTRNRTPCLDDRAARSVPSRRGSSRRSSSAASLRGSRRSRVAWRAADDASRRRTPSAQRAREGIARRREVMPHLADRDERGQRVAHHRQPQVLKPAVGHRGQLERKLRNRSARPPGVVAELARQREHRQDGHRERPVLAVTAEDGGAERAAAWCRPPRAAATRPIGRWRRRHCGRPRDLPAIFDSVAQHDRRRADVAAAADGVAPPAVGVLVLQQPGGAGRHERARDDRAPRSRAAPTVSRASTAVAVESALLDRCAVPMVGSRAAVEQPANEACSSARRADRGSSGITTGRGSDDPAPAARSRCIRSRPSSSAQVPKKPPRLVQSESTKSRHGSRRPASRHVQRRQGVQRGRRREQIRNGRGARGEEPAARVAAIEQPQADGPDRAASSR